jgi:hypothetical protein
MCLRNAVEKGPRVCVCNGAGARGARGGTLVTTGDRKSGSAASPAYTASHTSGCACEKARTHLRVHHEGGLPCGYECGCRCECGCGCDCVEE